MKKGIILILIFSGFFFLSFKITLKDLPKNYLYLLESIYQKDKNSIINIDFLSMIIDSYQTKNFFLKKDEVLKEQLEVSKVLYNEQKPLIYIYNTHSNEEYSYSKNDIYNIVPTVQTASNILEGELKKFGIESIIEKRNTIDIVNERGLSYSSSYKVSREFLEENGKNYNSLTYFIDIHRDSVKRNITTITIDGIDYARVMFLLGLENENYKENKEVITKLNNYLEENYKGLSRGIYEKQGKGVNGIYNQDYNKNVMLIEIGGFENTLSEVANTLKIIATCLNNYIENNKTTKVE